MAAFLVVKGNWSLGFYLAMRWQLVTDISYKYFDSNY